MKRLLRFLVLAATLVTGLTTVSAQTVQVLLTPKVPSLPSTVTSYLDDPFHYFNAQFIVNGAGSDGLDIFFDMEFTVSTSSFYVRTRPNSLPMQSIHLSEGVNIMRTDVLYTQVVNRTETNFDYSNPLNALQLPEGTYELCLAIYDWNDPGRLNNLTAGPCPSFDICYSGSAPELVSPLAGAQLNLNGIMMVPPTRKITFFWTPVISNCSTNRTRFKYQLKMVRVLNGQNYQDAIRYNPTVFSTEVRNQNYAVLDTLLDIKIQLERGALYVAQLQAEQINKSNSGENFIIANDGKSQPMPFYWGTDEYLINTITGSYTNNNYPNGNMGGKKPNAKNRLSRQYGFVLDDENEEGEITEGVEGLTLWDGGVEEVSELDAIIEEMQSPRIVGFSPKRHYLPSDGYYTIPMNDDLEVSFIPARHESFKNTSYMIELYNYMDGGVDSITAYEPIYREVMENVPDHNELISQKLEGWGAELEQGSLYYLQLTSSFTTSYWDYMIADTSFYVNEMLAEHVHDTISREFIEEELMVPSGVFFQWGDDPNVPGTTTPQWKAPLDRTGDDIYDPVNYELPTAVPEIKKADSFQVSWAPLKNVKKGDKVEYEVNVYELKSGQTPEEAVVLNDVLVTRTVTDATKISASDSDFFKVFSAKKTYVMTLSTSVNSESNFYHFENGNEALPIIFKIVK